MMNVVDYYACTITQNEQKMNPYLSIWAGFSAYHVFFMEWMAVLVYRVFDRGLIQAPLTQRYCMLHNVTFCYGTERNRDEYGFTICISYITR